MWWLPESAREARELSDPIQEMRDLWLVPRRAEIAKEIRAMGDPAYDLADWIFVDDDGTVGGATPLASVQTTINLNVDTKFRVHMLVDETAGEADQNVDIRVQFRIGAGGTWTNVGAATAVQYAASANESDNATIASGDRQTTGTPTGSYETGAFDEADGNVVHTFAAGNYTEVAYNLLVDSAQVNNGDVIYFRFTWDTTPNNTQTAGYPYLTAVKKIQGAASLSGTATLTTTAKVTHRAVAALSGVATISATPYNPPAYKDYYVDTVNGSSGNGGTDPDTDAWDSIATAESTINGRDIVSNHEIGRVWCTGTTADTGNLAFNPTIGYTDATHWWEIHGDGAGTDWDTSLYRIDITTTDWDGIDCQAGFLRVIDLQVKIRNSTSTFTTCIQHAGGGELWLDRLYLEGDWANSGADSVECVRNQGGGTVYMRNVIGRGANNYDVFDNNSGTMYAYACTAADSNDGDGFNACTVKNCVGWNNAGSDFNACSGDTNASEDGTADTQVSGRTTYYTSISDPFVDATNGDYALDPTVGVLTGAGLDLSGDATLPVTVDIENQARPSNPDIGAHQTMVYIAASLSGTATLTGTLTAAITTVQGEASLAATATLSASASRTLRPAASLAGTATVAAVLDRHRAVTASLSGTAALSAVLNRRRAPAASLSGVATVSAVVNRRRAPTASLSGTATITATGTAIGTVKGTASLTGTAILSAAAQATHRASAALSGVATVAAVAVRSRQPVASLSGTATVAANGLRTRSSPTALVASATLAGVGVRRRQPVASLGATATLAGAARVTHRATSSMSGTATITAVPGTIGTVSGAASLTATASLTGAGAVTHRPVASLTSTATVTASPHRRRQPTAALSGVATLSGSGLRTRQPTASLSGTATITATGTVTVATTQGAASLSATATMSASGRATHRAVASLLGSATLTASGSTLGTVTGSANLLATASLSASGLRIRQPVASLSGTATVSATGTIIYRTVYGVAALSGAAALSAVPHLIARAVFSASATATLTAVLSRVEDIDYVQVGEVLLTHAVGVGTLELTHSVGVTQPSVARAVNTGRITCRAL